MDKIYDKLASLDVLNDAEIDDEDPWYDSNHEYSFRWELEWKSGGDWVDYTGAGYYYEDEVPNDDM